MPADSPNPSPEAVDRVARAGGKGVIRKRANPAKARLMLDHLIAADAALCRAALTNVLTGTADRRLLDLLAVVRRFADDVERHVTRAHEDSA
jgi:DNA-binding TFAR19-related protein (PDSD5 family)